MERASTLCRNGANFLFTRDNSAELPFFYPAILPFFYPSILPYFAEIECVCADATIAHAPTWCVCSPVNILYFTRDTNILGRSYTVVRTARFYTSLNCACVLVYTLPHHPSSMPRSSKRDSPPPFDRIRCAL